MFLGKVKIKTMQSETEKRPTGELRITKIVDRFTLKVDDFC